VSISIYDVVNPEQSTVIPDDSNIRYELSDSIYVEVRLEDGELEIRCAGRYVPFIVVMPVVSNVIKVGVNDRYNGKQL
jgi:hypothetical protein